MVQLLAIVLEQRSPSPRKFRPEVPQGLAKVVLRCLEKQPGERLKSYADLAQALAPYSSTAPTPATMSLRFLAGVVDMVLLCGLAMVINLSAFGSPMAYMEQVMQLSSKALVCMLEFICVATLYYALFEGLWGASAGKALCRLRVVGPSRNAPGFTRAWLRALVYVVPPLVPYWATFGTNPKAYMSASQLTQMLLGFSIYGVIALLFVTARRRNGFAAVQDLLTKTRVVSRAALTSRPVLPASDALRRVGHYHRPLSCAAGAHGVCRGDMVSGVRPETLAQGLDSSGFPGHGAGTGPVALSGQGWPPALAHQQTVAR